MPILKPVLMGISISQITKLWIKRVNRFKKKILKMVPSAPKVLRSNKLCNYQ